ncbi:MULTISPECIES: phosphoglucomutase/phosphomannomutase family protein [Prochlorococcus]|uniref:Phosphomannomutase n=1 Tax=Prochlorococcus marinus (strain SARG / CCMP1375 / SS120) TaxID=167539 RepID=Q7VDQ8_PROMA|nr:MULTISPECIES: phosphoglucomutase/phosphomannomutase family protein [Prochlorococcus]AAP99356.1 Phosphomannomutase [Prochlorococcus marinus subsp. marinus str. CCMP1375]KGG11373.1 Phosphoglucosamine mutase [Prochlorococcus marinus str. LG]KGG18672.1 Phosphoglucosamine mutase [Prochlorococcus marinus str. SS2]KGG22945.1 Phosphoglucosamine mutase [Prochlorococcus marinus str. SS35]KGG34049.1 Phosphoglucosamine mutase [Prochlorococcus marinus str. SS51]
MKFQAAPIKFGTDGWRGVLGVDITIERLIRVAVASAQEMAYRAKNDSTNKVVIGYDRRFLASEFAEAIADAVRGCSLYPLLADVSVTTPSCSWAVVENNALGALVITASHNPPEWLGLKIKGPLGRSVEEDFTKAVEERLLTGGITAPILGETEKFSCRQNHLIGLKRKMDIPALLIGIRAMGLKVIVDSMHGSAAGCMTEILGNESHDFLKEIRTKRDPLFGGNAPEPLAKNLDQLIVNTQELALEGHPVLGLAFDGDGDRIAAIDETGRFCSTQLLIPLFIEHMAGVRNLPGCVIKTVSGSDCIRLIAKDFDREVIERPVGFKYIAQEMLSRKVLLGGEESGGIGFGDHLPERDALYAALLLLESIVYRRKPLGSLLDNLQKRLGTSFYDRFDLLLSDNDSRQRLEKSLKINPPLLVEGKKVKEVIELDGCKLRFDERHWLMFRFSGTEPLLRIYCEAPTYKEVEETLAWAKNFASQI